MPTASCVPDQLPLLTALSVAREPRPRSLRAPAELVSVSASDPAALVTSPVCAGSCDACKVPLSAVAGIVVLAVIVLVPLP